MRISVFGLGHLGLPLAALLAGAGHAVLGVDLDPAHVAALRLGEVGWHEPGLTELCRGVAANMHFTVDAADAVASDVSIIAVPSPADASGGYDGAYVLAAARTIGGALRGHTRPHVVAVLSTVMPGSCAGPVRAALEESSGRQLGEALGICYCPAFGAIGSLLHDYRNPDFLLIGESGAPAGAVVAALFASILQNQPAVLHHSLLDAELAKITLNNYIITKITFANMVGELCGRIEGADAAQVLDVLGHDRRIGPKFLRAAMPYGGPCFARDTGALEALAAPLGLIVPLATATARMNAAQQAALTAQLAGATPAGGVIAILGLAFRAKTDVLTASPAVAIATQLAQAGFQVRAWDPLARPDLPSVIRATTLVACVTGADTVLIANDDPLCAALPEVTRTDGTKVIVFDPWRILPANSPLDVR
jgi:UDPglucose 6-dehydrogenase